MKIFWRAVLLTSTFGGFAQSSYRNCFAFFGHFLRLYKRATVADLYFVFGYELLSIQLSFAKT